MMGGLAGAASAANNPVAADSAQGMNGAGAGGGALSQQKDAKDSSTEAKFGDVLKNLQTQYGEKKEKPREIKKTLDKDDFLKIMITQMRHQDPTSPFKPEQMASEIAQFTSLEQLKNVNDNLGKLAKANQPSERLAMTSLIGKTVTVDRDRFNHTEGQNEVVSFKLPRDAKSAKVALIHENGETVLEREIGSNKQGEVSFQWDGLKSNTLPAKGGNYMLQVDARDERDVPIPVSGQAQV